MPDAWKDHERKVAKYFKTTRRLRGDDFSQSDIEVLASVDTWLGWSGTNAHIAVECKHTKKNGIVNTFKSIASQYVSKDKIPIIRIGDFLLCNLEDFEEVFKKYDKTENFMFLDPPYDGCCKNLYIHEFSMEDHKRLFACFKNAKAKCLLIISETEFIRELYKDFIVSHYEYGYSVNNSQASKKTHLVIKNYK